jgi:hypothetical protein
MWAMSNHPELDGTAVDPWAKFEADFLRLARRGLLGPPALLVAAYVCYAGSAIAVTWISGPLAGFLLAVGLSLHIVEVFVLLRDGALHLGVPGREQLDAPERRSVRHRFLLKATMLPSAARWLTLDLRAFSGRAASDLLDTSPRVFLNAINLENGVQTVIDGQTMATLRRESVDAQWSKYHWRLWELADNTPLALPVAASMAFPPWFRPVPIVTKQSHWNGTKESHFLDGGVTDNAGFRLARALVSYTERHLDHRPPTWSFRDCVGVTMTFDASRPPEEKRRVASRISGLKRLGAIIQFSQSAELELADETLQGLDVVARSFGLQVGFLDRDDLDDLTPRLRRIRTHLDGFTLTEIATISYCGYTHIDRALSDPEVVAPFPHEIAHCPPAVSLEEHFVRLGAPVPRLRRLDLELARGAALVSLPRLGRRVAERHERSPRPPEV